MWRWLTTVLGVTIGVRAALLWHDINEATANIRAMRRFRL